MAVLFFSRAPRGLESLRTKRSAASTSVSFTVGTAIFFVRWPRLNVSFPVTLLKSAGVFAVPAAVR